MNCAAHGVATARFVLADDSLSRLDGTFDLVHSFIVFQHLPVDRGERLLSLLLDRIAPGGAGALHFLVGERRSPAQRLAAFVRRRVPLGRNVVNVLRGRPFGAPNMEMNAYDLARLLRILGDHGVGEVCVEGTDHGGYLGAMLVFRR